MIAAQQAVKGIRRIRLCRFAKVTGENIEPGTEVHTGGGAVSHGLAKLGFQHKVIRETPDLGDNLLPLVNRIASLLKRWLLGTPQGAVQRSHLDYYLDE